MTQPDVLERLKNREVGDMFFGDDTLVIVSSMITDIGDTVVTIVYKTSVATYSAGFELLHPIANWLKDPKQYNVIYLGKINDIPRELSDREEN